MANNASHSDTSRSNFNGSKEFEIKGASNVATQATKLSSDVRSGLSALGSAVQEASVETLSEAGKMAGEALEVAKKQGLEKAHQLEREIREYPLASLGVAFVGGLFLGMLFKRS